MPDIDAGARDRAMNKTDMFQWVNSSSASFDTGKLIDPAGPVCMYRDRGRKRFV